MFEIGQKVKYIGPKLHLIPGEIYTVLNISLERYHIRVKGCDRYINVDWFESVKSETTPLDQIKQMFLYISDPNDKKLLSRVLKCFGITPVFQPETWIFKEN